MSGPVDPPRDPADVPGSEPSAAAGSPPNPQEYDSPRAVQARARGLAAPYIAGGTDPDPEDTRRRERRYLLLLVAMVVVIVLGGFVLGIVANVIETLGSGAGSSRVAAAASVAGASGPPPTSAAPGGSPAPAASAGVEPGASHEPALGALVDGIPATIDGAAVVRGAAVLQAGSASTDAQAFLLGGWFHATANSRFCTFYRPPRPVDACAWGFDLFLDSSSKLGTTLARGTDGDATVATAATSIRPVVLRVHSHDPLCVGEYASCRKTIVLEAVAWLGPTLAELRAPTDTPPATSFSRHDALAKARAKLGSAYVLKSARIVRETTAESILFGPVAEDPWVWWLRYRVPGTGDTAEYLFDYRTGKQLMAGFGHHA